MATKALHLVLASDLSTETFLMSFSRFISRRGPIQQMHSDCGTNFVGASKMFETVDKFTQSAEYQKKCRSFLAARNISWHFNPPSAPHFGGLWEAGVKSTKTLIHRTIGLHRLKYKELNTLLTRIEATLNSRPLSALSPDPLDFEALTPSHFLTLAKLNCYNYSGPILNYIMCIYASIGDGTFAVSGFCHRTRDRLR